MEKAGLNITPKEFKELSKLAENAYNITVVIDYFCKNQPEIEELYNLAPVIENLHPGMGDRLWRQDRDNARGRASLEALADFRSVQTAGNAGSAKKRHEKCCLGVALTVSIREHLLRSESVRAVISEKDLISDIVIDRADPAECVEIFPSARIDQLLDRCGVIVYHRGLLKIFIFHTVPLSAAP